jgi:hypothetical protein
MLKKHKEKSSPGGDVEAPAGWVIRESRSRPGEICYQNLLTGKRQFKRPRPVSEFAEVLGQRGQPPVLPAPSSDQEKSAKSPSSDRSEPKKRRLERPEHKERSALEEKARVTKKKTKSHRESDEEVEEAQPKKHKNKEMKPNDQPSKLKASPHSTQSETSRGVKKHQLKVRANVHKGDAKQKSSVSTFQDVPSKMPLSDREISTQTVVCSFREQDCAGERISIDEHGKDRTDSLLAAVKVEGTGQLIEIGTVVSYLATSSKHSPVAVLGIICGILVPAKSRAVGQTAAVRLNTVRLHKPSEVGAEGAATVVLLAEKPTDWVLPSEVLAFPTVSFIPKTRRSCEFYCSHVWLSRHRKIVDIGEYLKNYPWQLSSKLRCLMGIDDVAIKAAEEAISKVEDSVHTVTETAKAVPLRSQKSVSIPMRHNSLMQFRILDESTWTADTVDWRLPNRIEHVVV